MSSDIHSDSPRAESGHDWPRTDEKDAVREVENSVPATTPSSSDFLPDVAIIFPDGGLRAWLVVFGVCCVTFSTFGFVNSWGTFQSYYEQNLLKETSASAIAWIGSIQYALTFFPAILTGRMFDTGFFRLPIGIASIILVVATILTAQCTTYWEFILCQGVTIGLCCGVIFSTAISVVAHWFKKRRSTALGVIAVGSSAGGTVFPIVFQSLVASVGFPWTMRILGFILLLSLGVANMLMRQRLPPTKQEGGLLNLKAFRNMSYSVYTLAGFVTFLGLYTVLTFINISAISNGVSSNFAFYLVSIANASSTVGRLGGGVVADQYGALNVMIPFTLAAGVLTYVWPFVEGTGPYIVIAVLYGIASGAFLGLIAAPIIAMGEVHDVGRRLGMYFSLLAFGAISGPPISGAIDSATDGYTVVGIYAGTVILLSVALLCVSRYYILGQMKGRC